MTVILTEAEAVPPAPVAVAVYVVLLAGVIWRESLRLTAPTPLSMLTDVALEVDHASTALDP